MKTWLVAGLLSASLSSLAATTPMTIGSQGAETNKTPRTGQSMVTVRESFGSPMQEAPAVGEPPITRWVYKNFTVYFEHDKVIHAVKHKS